MQKKVKIWGFSIFLEDHHTIHLTFYDKDKTNKLKEMIKSDFLRWTANKEDVLFTYTYGENDEVIFDPKRFLGLKINGIYSDKHKELQIEFLQESIRELKSKSVGDEWRGK